MKISISFVIIFVFYIMFLYYYIYLFSCVLCACVVCIVAALLYVKFQLRAYKVFRNLIPKMLNPISKDRLTIQELQTHAWIYGSHINELPSIDDDWHKQVIQLEIMFLFIIYY